MKNLESEPYKERLKETEMFRLWKRWDLRGDIIVVLKYMKGFHKEERKHLFLSCCREQEEKQCFKVATK